MLLAVLTACGNHRRSPPMQHDEKLVIHIHQDGTKLFAYAVAMGGPGGGMGAPGSGTKGPPPGGGQAPGHNTNAGGGRGPRGDAAGDLTESLKVKLNATGYCREGYVEMERYAYQNSQWIRGECREGANEQDWARFGSRVSLY